MGNELFEGMSLAHCGVWSLSEARRLFTTCEKNLSVRHRDINLLHLPLAMHTVLSFVKHLLSPKIRSRIQSHSSDEEDVELWDKFAEGSDALPKEAGGTSETSLADMGAAWRKELMANRKRLLDRDLMTVATEKSRGWFSFY